MMLSSVRRACLAAVLAVLAVLGGVVVTALPDCVHEHCQTMAAAPQGVPQPSPTEPAKLTITPKDKADDVEPLAPVAVTAVTGSVTSVRMLNDAGKEIAGALSPDGRVWKPATALGYGRTYTMNVVARGPGGMPTRASSTFTTVTPTYQANVYLNGTSGAPLRNGETYGVGMVIVARFDQTITDKAGAERRMKVTTEPKTVGSWNWIDDQTAHWRPQKYYAPGTKVTVDAEIYGARLGEDLYGAQDEKVSFTIGDSHVSIADDNTKQVSVYENGKLVRTMPTSMGMGGTETVNGVTLSFWTPRGVYTVMDKANPVVMDSSTYGLPVGSRLGYRTTIPYATRISVDGIYLHQLNDTIWAQGNTNVSHGCLNLSGENAQWFYNFSRPGDIVEIRNTGGEPLKPDNNGDWTIPWEQWRKGSALN
ncbi:L,D-transpeptidase [Mycolicibacterium goodii]|uniref:L,D-transpeptidase family protein n=1 Tax=Mycolicibacterium goodii TaxID=134601 RepID=A0ABS6HU45_MYCGD|nr:Ig-like domain-containing protein [Mycolicibacterium goodii]MBU8817811.1 L,D-transpeptidase family protein [Mycolicibacterium goodii]MBU8825430.1 L,D-transpeptidase family protein [Mycolicibacterium goodii]MBU8838576.1 L,D-transpeptidase family protein [Mycolicibacterium goodii]